MVHVDIRGTYMVQLEMRGYTNMVQVDMRVCVDGKGEHDRINVCGSGGYERVRGYVYGQFDMRRFMYKVQVNIVRTCM